MPGVCGHHRVERGRMRVWRWRSRLPIAGVERRTERLQKELAAYGITVGAHWIKRLRRKLGLCCRQKRRFRVTTHSKHSLPAAENLLARKFATSVPGQVWLYLASHKDMCIREIVGYAMSNRMTKNLVCQSLFRAVTAKPPTPELIHHSDRGSQYCSRSATCWFSSGCTPP